MTVNEMAKMMDMAALGPALTDGDIRRLAEQCAAYRIGCFCVRPTDVEAAARLLDGAGVRIACVVGFPHGASRPETKALEARLAIGDGADELDMVMNIGKFLSGDEKAVREDIRGVVAAARPSGAPVKVILETCLLDDEQIRRASLLAMEAGAAYVKTSTGFNGPGATPGAVRIMREAVAPAGGKVKASGGIRCWDAALSYAEMGADRLGVSAAPAILEEGRARES